MSTPNTASRRGRSTAAISGSSRSSQKQCIYRGVRSRGEKWVSEIRERRKPGRIWLGTYTTPEMAAAAYDAASLALKWPNAILNFPDQASTYPIPASLAAMDIQIAAAAAAAAATREPPHEPAAPEQSLSHPADQYIDEEEMFDMPSLLADMAEGMLMTPPTVICDSDPAQYFEGDGLWSF